MYGWLQKHIKSRTTSSTQCGKGKIRENSAMPISILSTSSSSSSLLPLTPSEPRQLRNALNSELRWRQKYDVFVCHSSAQTDIEEAIRLVLFLEAVPRSLRCFLWHRDTCPGGAIATEFCQAMQDSHIRALLITPSFVQDDWCNYVMHQALAEGPMSNRMIPLLQNLPHAEYPQEMRFYYYIDLSKNPDHGFSLVYRTVYRYLENLTHNETKSGCDLSDSVCGGDAHKRVK
uniref:Toll-interleukin 1 receptor (TIR) domain containing adaptor protein n=1 Tax=Nothobranchius kadleci TaxID=1051664 RepID=A0A1A8BKR0_NOTKA